LTAATARRDDLVGLHAQLFAHVDRRGRDEGVDAAVVDAGQRLADAVDVGVGRACQAAHPAVADRGRDRAHGLEIARAGVRKTRLDDVHAHARSFSSRVMVAPGLCSPSRSVVSKMISRSVIGRSVAWVQGRLSSPRRRSRRRRCSSTRVMTMPDRV
jgi:hypothetical protein